MIKNYFATWTSSFSLCGDKSRGQVYERAYVECEKAAQKQVQKIELVDKVVEIGKTIDNENITPYISVAVGKESSEGSLISRWYGVTLSLDGSCEIFCVNVYKERLFTINH
jgi:hypothetical protein